MRMGGLMKVLENQRVDCREIEIIFVRKRL